MKPPFDYTHCRVCGKEVDVGHEEYARYNITNAICGVECHRKEELKRHACCDMARPLSRNCVCAYATECPIHGERHFGTHD